MTNLGNGAVYQSKQKYSSNTFGVTSTLIYGVQWDAIMTWIDSAYKTGTCNSTSFVVNSTNKGYYNQSSETTIGSNSNYSIKNIYDLAGNVYEWTMESCDTVARVLRGGDNYDSGTDGPASYRTNFDPDFSGQDIGFRPALYL